MARGRKTALMVQLTADERQTLRAWQRSATIPAGVARRSRMIVLLADGTSISEASRRVGLSRHFVYKWARRFLEHRLEGLTNKRGHGQPRFRPLAEAWTPCQRCSAMELSCSHPAPLPSAGGSGVSHPEQTLRDHLRGG